MKLIFLVKPFFYMTKNLRRKFKNEFKQQYLENENSLRLNKKHCSLLFKGFQLTENSKVKSPFRRFWIRPKISSYMFGFMDDVFDKYKKACFRPCLTSWWSKVDSEVLFRSQRLILTFSEIWQSGNLEVCERNTINL